MNFTAIDFTPYVSEWLEGPNRYILVFEPFYAVVGVWRESAWHEISHAEKHAAGFVCDETMTPTMREMLRQTLEKVLRDKGMPTRIITGSERELLEKSARMAS